MKVKVEITLDFEEGVPAPLNEDILSDLVAEGLVQYAIRSHLRDAFRLSIKNNGEQKETVNPVLDHHVYWADLLEKSMPSLRIARQE